MYGIDEKTTYVVTVSFDDSIYFVNDKGYSKEYPAATEFTDLAKAELVAKAQQYPSEVIQDYGYETETVVSSYNACGEILDQWTRENPVRIVLHTHLRCIPNPVRFLINVVLGGWREFHNPVVETEAEAIDFFNTNNDYLVALVKKHMVMLEDFTETKHSYKELLTILFYLELVELHNTLQSELHLG